MSKFSFLKKPDVLLFYDAAVADVLRKMSVESDAARAHQLHASLLDDPFCVRCALDAATSEPDPHRYTVSRLLNFLDGVARHRKWQNLFMRMGWSSYDETERPVRLGGVVCTPDQILNVGGERYVWECKSVSSRRFDEIRRSGPPKAFLDRLHVYFAATGLRKGILHVENKDTNEYVTFLVEADDALVGEMRRRAKLLEDAYRVWKKTGRKPGHTCAST